MSICAPDTSADGRVILDTQARRRYGEILLRLYQGVIDPDEYEDGYFEIKTQDPALRGVHRKIQEFYEDLFPSWPRKAKGKQALSPEGREFFERCILFLRCDEEWAIHLEEVALAEPTELHRTKRRLFWISLCILVLANLILISASPIWIVLGLLLIPICLYLLERVLMLFWKSKGIDVRMYRCPEGTEYWPFDNKAQYELCVLKEPRPLPSANTLESDSLISDRGMPY